PQTLAHAEEALGGAGPQHARGQDGETARAALADMPGNLNPAVEVVLTDDTDVAESLAEADFLEGDDGLVELGQALDEPGAIVVVAFEKDAHGIGAAVLEDHRLVEVEPGRGLQQHAVVV